MRNEGGAAAEERPDQRAEGRRGGLVMLGALVPLLALLGLLAWALIQSGGQPAGIGINSMFGQVSVDEAPARDFSLALFGGGDLRLSDLRGQVVMVDFWSSWCGPCREEAPALQEAYRRFRGRGVEFVGVAIWDSEREATKFIAEVGQQYPTGLDSRGLIAIDYGVTGIPEKYFVDRDGVLVSKFVGPVTVAELDRVLTELLAR